MNEDDGRLCGESPGDPHPRRGELTLVPAGIFDAGQVGVRCGDAGGLVAGHRQHLAPRRGKNTREAAKERLALGKLQEGLGETHAAPLSSGEDHRDRFA